MMKKWKQNVKKLLLLAMLVLTTCPAAPAVCHADEAEAPEGIVWDSYEEISSGSCGKKVNYTVYKTGEDTYALRLYGTGKTSNFIVGHNDYQRPWIAKENGGADEGEDAPGYTNITQIVVEEGITTIGYGAFRKCSNIREVRLPDSLSSLGG